MTLAGHMRIRQHTNTHFGSQVRPKTKLDVETNVRRQTLYVVITNYTIISTNEQDLKENNLDAHKLHLRIKGTFE